jgi:hypothetical protein
VPVHELFKVNVCALGQVIVGTVVSTRFTLNVHVAVLPAASVAVKVTTVVPNPVMAVPAAGDWVITILPVGVQLSERVANVV